MIKGLGKKFKKGAASFYIVAFATLILVVVASSFAVVIISEIARTSNDDLSQSAYDAALAGVEDAKLAYANYRACLEKQPVYPDSLTGDAGVSCQDIVYWMKHPDCDMVAHILGRISKTDKGEVLIQETTTAGGGSSNNINEAYTCAMIETSLTDYRASLSSSNLYQIVKVNLDKGVRAADIEKVKISWYSQREGAIYNFTNVLPASLRVGFQSLKSTKAATPPTISVGLIQTANAFTLDQLNGKTTGGRTDRATVYLVPTDNKAMAQSSTANNYVGVYNGSENVLTAAQLASTNDHMKDLPFVTYCNPNSDDEFICSATMTLPKPIGGDDRSDETFMFVVAIPYEQPDTDFSLEFICKEGNPCSSVTNPDGTVTTSNVATTDGVQVVIDSTGRANDLYRRVEMRLEATDSTFAYPMYAIQVLGGNSGYTAPLEKNMTVTTEHQGWVDNVPAGTAVSQNKLTIYPVVDGTEYASGRAGFTFNVYVDGRLVASNVNTWSKNVDNGSDISIVPNNADGYTVTGGPYEFVLSENTTVRPAWTVRKYTVDVNPIVSGTTYSTGMRGFTFDVYLNGILTRSNVLDYYNEAVPYGTVVKVVPKNRSGCYSSTIERTITSNTTITPNWQGTCVYTVDVNPTVHGVNYPSGRDGFTFSVYLDDAIEANGVTDFYQTVAVDTKVRVLASNVSGYTLSMGDTVIEKLKNSQDIRPTWTGAPNKIQYDANGGSWQPYDQACYVSTIAPCYITTNEPSRSGYRFLGWSTSSSATTAMYAPGGEVEVTGDMILYAVWTTQNEEITILAEWTNNYDYDSYMKLSKPGSNGYEDANWGTTNIPVTYNGTTYSLITGAGDGRGSINGRYYEKFTINTLGGKNYYYSMKNWSSFGTIGTDITITVSGPYIGEKKFYSSSLPSTSCKYWNVFAYKDGRLFEKKTCTDSMDYGY